MLGLKLPQSHVLVITEVPDYLLLDLLHRSCAIFCKFLAAVFSSIAKQHWPQSEGAWQRATAKERTDPILKQNSLVILDLTSLGSESQQWANCLLFPSLMNNDWFVWIACKTLLDSRTRTTLSLIVIWANVGPRILIVCNFLILLLIAILLLDSFGHRGHRVQHDVLLVWTGLWHGEFFFRWPFVAECCIAGSNTDVGLPMYRVKCTNLMSEPSKPPVT